MKKVGNFEDFVKKMPEEKKMSNVSKKFLIENKFLQIWPVKQG